MSGKLKLRRSRCPAQIFSSGNTGSELTQLSSESFPVSFSESFQLSSVSFSVSFPAQLGAAPGGGEPELQPDTLTFSGVETLLEVFVDQRSLVLRHRAADQLMNEMMNESRKRLTSSRSWSSMARNTAALISACTKTLINQKHGCPHLCLHKKH